MNKSIQKAPTRMSSFGDEFLINEYEPTKSIIPTNQKEKNLMDIIDIDTEVFMKANEVAQLLQCSEAHVYNMIKANLIPVVALGEPSVSRNPC
jgi:hypothetical protein